MNTPEDWKKMLEDQGNGYNQRIGALENISRSVLVRLGNLETARDKAAFDAHAVKSQAAAAQATQHLYAPLRSDTKPLLEMSAFVRRLAAFDFLAVNDENCVAALMGFVDDAAELVKKYT